MNACRYRKNVGGRLCSSHSISCLQEATSQGHTREGRSPSHCHHQQDGGAGQLGRGGSPKTKLEGPAPCLSFCKGPGNRGQSLQCRQPLPRSHENVHQQQGKPPSTSLSTMGIGMGHFPAMSLKAMFFLPQQVMPPPVY